MKTQLRTDREYQRRAITRNILVVAYVNPGPDDWVAYIGAVPGKNHDDEWQAVALEGDKLPEPVASYYFPGLASTHRWRP